MNERAIETGVGFFVIIGLICVGYLAVKLGKMEWFSEDTYPIYAHFQTVSGLKRGAYVEMAGVQIGQVASISLDQKEKVALVKINVKKGVVLEEDAIASVTTAGLIGDRYINITPGASDRVLKPGGLITETESAVNLEELISKYVFGGV